MKTRFLLLFLLLFGATAFGQVNNLQVSWGVVKNGYQGKLLFVSEFTIENKGNLVFNDKKWTFWFNSCKTVVADSVSPTVKITHINGDFYRMEPTSTFPVLNPGEKIKIRMISNTWAIIRGDAPSGGYFVSNGIPSAVNIQLLPFLSLIHI